MSKKTINDDMNAPSRKHTPQVSSAGPARTPMNIGVTSRDKGGFTLIETFVAVTILMMAILGPLTLATRGVFSALAARDQLVATYLAEDAMESIRAVRDSNWVTGGGVEWLNNLNDCLAPNFCQIDSTQDPIQTTTCSGACEELRYNQGTGYYQYQSGDLSGFTRTVQISGPVGGNTGDEERLVTVRVEWNTGPLEREFTAKQLIYDWYNVDVE